jgi:hypothetical protein
MTMTRPYPDALSLTRRFLTVLIVLNVVMGVLILALLVASLVAEAWVWRALGVSTQGAGPMMIPGMRMVMALGIAAVPVTYVVLAGLRAIVDTVRRGDPFVGENAGRLKRIGWAVLGLEVLHLAVGATVAAASTRAAPLDIGWRFSVTPWLAVLLLFVLARVFEQGTQMREDLEGTV